MKKRRAYSLLEVSIALFIVAILLTSGSLLFSNISKNQNIQEAQIITLERTDKIYKAILNYLSENKRLPCPARLDIAYNDNNYGSESRTGEDCDEINNSPLPAFNFLGDGASQTVGVSGNNMKIVYGMVPIDVLNLGKKDAEDGYGRKFSYVMIKEFGTKIGVSLGFESYAGSDRLGEANIFEYINIKDNSSGTNVTISDKAIMLLISHGENGAGAYNPDTGAQLFPQPFITDEVDNFYQDTTPTPYNKDFFIDSNETNILSGEPITFDDFVIFKTKDQIIRDSELEFMQCSVEQGFINSNYDVACFSGDGSVTQKSYGETSDVTATLIGSDATNCGCDTSNAILQRTCGKYGKWSDIFCNEYHKVQILDEVRADSTSGLKLYDDSGANGIFIEDGGNVGINQSNPESHLDIDGDASISGVMNINNFRLEGVVKDAFDNGILNVQSGSFATSTEIRMGRLDQDIRYSSIKVKKGEGSYMQFLVHDDVNSAPYQGQVMAMHMTHQGRVGIKDSTPSYDLDVNGTFRAYGITDSSDARYKKNIAPISNILSKILQLNAVHYDWRKEDFPDKNFSKDRQIGFIAQEVEKIFPELVSTDEEGYKSISYGKVTVFLVSAIRELQENHQKEIADLRKEYDQKIDKLIKRIEKLENAN